jgi:AraC-like DNA-binding protein
MSELSATPIERARKAHGRVLRALEEPGTARNLAQVLGTSETTVSRLKNEKLEDAITLIYHLGFKVVAQDQRCYPTEYVEALHVMARMHMQAPPTQLEWE